MTSKILFTTDYSPQSNVALRYAISLARQAHSSLVVLHVDVPGLLPTPEDLDRQQDHRQSSLLSLLTGVSDGEPVPHEFIVAQGDAAAEIVRAARNLHVDSIVMATRGRTGLRKMLLGSVAAVVSREAPCPVITVNDASDASSNIGSTTGNAKSTQQLSQDGDHGPLQRGFGGAMSLLQRGIDARATDIHIDPFDNNYEIRFRIDGQLERFCLLDQQVAHPLITQLKVLAEVDIADPFRPSEGHISIPNVLEGHEVRLTRVPVTGGDSIALRLLDKQRVLRPLDALGLSAEGMEQLQAILKAGEGLILVTGPAGAGKTTTAYSMIHSLDNGRRNIVTIEDPIEYRISGFRQMAVDARRDLTMTNGLRCLLRMDPDVVLVGEIRDSETAETAMRAASSGKYVFTTLHTRDVASTITALRDLHIDNRSLADNLTGIVSQRLVRRVCSHCRTQAILEKSQEELFTRHDLSPPAQLASLGKCPICRESGYYERIGVFEVVAPNQAIREAIERGAAEDDLRSLLRSAGTRSLMSDGLQKVRDQVTTLDEIHAMTWASPAG